MPAADTTDSRRLGDVGEEIALLYLQAQGHECLSRQFRTRYGEIDLIVRHDEILAFVEVKTRRGLGFGRPEEAVDIRKLRTMRRVAGAFLATVRVPGVVSYRFDVVAILFGRDGMSLSHFRGAGVF